MQNKVILSDLWITWNDNLNAIFEAKLTFKFQSFSLFVGGISTILQGMYGDLMFSLWFKK